MHSNPSYGSRRIATELGLQRKVIRRIMRKYGLKPVLLRGKKPWKREDEGKPEASFSNPAYRMCPLYPNIIWAGDFTYIKYKGQFLYLATVIDVYTREIIGVAVSFHHSGKLVLAALEDAIKTRECLPIYFHSDQGSEYQGSHHADYLISLGVIVSMSKKSSPWQNGYQESFYNNFKLELKNVNNYLTVAHLIEAIYLQIHYYNYRRIHSAHDMPPAEFMRLTQDIRERKRV